MKIILSPAKKMNIDTDMMEVRGEPLFMEKTQQLLDWLSGLSFEDAKKLWGCNEKLAQLNFERLHGMDLHRNLTPALLSYEGIAYQYMAPKVFEGRQWEYVQKHLRILSGFYGVLKPLDGVILYRLEMQAKGAPGDVMDLYAFWGSAIYDALAWEEEAEGEPLIINLASKEYSRCVGAYIKPPMRMITCVFGELVSGKIVQKGTMAKMARGEMVRYMAEREICPEGEDGRSAEEVLLRMKEFDRLGYRFCEEASGDGELVFLKI